MSGTLVQAGDFGVRPVAFGASASIRTGGMLSAGRSTGQSIGVEAACGAARVQAVVGICPIGVLLVHGTVVMMVVVSVTRAVQHDDQRPPPRSVFGTHDQDRHAFDLTIRFGSLAMLSRSTTNPFSVGSTSRTWGSSGTRGRSSWASSRALTSAGGG